MSSKLFSKRLLSRKAKYTINPQEDKAEEEEKEADPYESEDDVVDHQMLPQNQEGGQQTQNQPAAKKQPVRRTKLCKRVLCIVMIAGLIVLTTSLSLKIGTKTNSYSHRQDSNVKSSQLQSSYEQVNNNHSEGNNEQMLKDKNEGKRRSKTNWKRQNVSLEINKLNSSYSQLLAEAQVNTSQLQSSYEKLNNYSQANNEEQILKDQNEVSLGISKQNSSHSQLLSEPEVSLEISEQNNSYSQLHGKVLVNTSQPQSSYDILNQNHSQIKTEDGRQISKEKNKIYFVDKTANSSLPQSSYEELTKNHSLVKDEVQMLMENNTVNTSQPQSSYEILNQTHSQLNIEAQMQRKQDEVTLEISKLNNSYSQLLAKLLDMAVNTSQFQRSYETLKKNHSLLKNEVQMLKDKTEVGVEISKLNNSYSELLARFLGMAANVSELQRSYEMMNENHNQVKYEVQMLKDRNKVLLEIRNQNNSYSELLVKLLDSSKINNYNLVANTSELQSSYEILTKNHSLLKEEVQQNKNKVSLEIKMLNNSYSQLLTNLLDMAVNTSELQSRYETLEKNHSLLKDEVQMLKDKNEAMAVNISQLQSSFEILKNEVQLLKELHDGWTKFGDHKYFKSTEKKNWNDARLDCQNRGADLVVINSEDEKKFIIKLTEGREMLIGLRLERLEKRESVWRWVDGTLLSKDFSPRSQPKRLEIIATCCTPYGKWIPTKHFNFNWICEK